MRIVRSASLAAVALTASAVLAPQTAAAATSSSSDAWVITVKTATYPTLQAERDRVMQDATNAGYTTGFLCTRDEQACNETFVVSDIAYRTLVTHFRYDPAIVSIKAVG